MTKPVLAGPRKAAIALMAMPEELACGVLAKLSPEDLAGLRREVETLDEVPDEVVLDVVRELAHQVATPLAMARATGPAYLRRLAQRAFGSERADELLGDAQPEPRQRVLEATPAALARVLGGERPELAALVLTQLLPGKAAAVLEELGDPRARDVLSALGRVSQVPSPTSEVVLQTVAQALDQAELALGAGPSAGFDGPGFAAAVLDEIRRVRGAARAERLGAKAPWDHQERARGEREEPAAPRGAS